MSDKIKDKKYQKGERRQRLHKNQDNVGNPKKPDYFENHDGSSIK